MDSFMGFAPVAIIASLGVKFTKTIGAIQFPPHFRALAGASFGQMLGGAIGNLTVACFAAGTPLVVDFEGSSRSIEDIEVGDYVLARSEFDAAGPRSP
jgi:hypothetical protein